MKAYSTASGSVMFVPDTVERKVKNAAALSYKADLAEPKSSSDRPLTAPAKPQQQDFKKAI